MDLDDVKNKTENKKIIDFGNSFFYWDKGIFVYWDKKNCRLEIIKKLREEK